jgi:hypothetical protein
MSARHRLRQLACALAFVFVGAGGSATVGCDKSHGTSSGGSGAAPSASVFETSSGAPAAPSATATAADPIPPGPGKPRTQIKKYDEAVSAFRAAWAEEVAPSSATHSPKTSDHQAAVMTGTSPRARQEMCRQAYKLALPTRAANSPSAGLVLFASVPALDREGVCWELIAADATAEVHGYLDAKTGALVTVYLVPLI